MRYRYILPLLVPFSAAIPCSAAIYVPISTVLNAQTGKSAWEGPADYSNLGSATGLHSVNSTFSYLSAWSDSSVNVSATSSADLEDSLITLEAFNSSNGYDYNVTQADASAVVSFYLPAGGTFNLNESAQGFEPAQTPWSVTGPGGWSWSGPMGQAVLAPAGEYTFSIEAFVERGVGIDMPSNISASLQLGPAGAATIPEPDALMILAAAPLVLMGRRRRLQYRPSRLQN